MISVYLCYDGVDCATMLGYEMNKLYWVIMQPLGIVWPHAHHGRIVRWFNYMLYNKCGYGINDDEAFSTKAHVSIHMNMLSKQHCVTNRL